MLVQKIQSALAYASVEHAKAGCSYGKYPYKKHLIDVLGVAFEFGIQNPTVLVAIPLHDLLEDTDVQYSLLAERFGVVVADTVKAVTNPSMENGKKLSREERFRISLPIIAASEAATLVKLCDRIANVRACWEDLIGPKSKNFLAKYKKEYGMFRKHLYSNTQSHMEVELWRELDQLMNWMS